MSLFYDKINGILASNVETEIQFQESATPTIKVGSFPKGNIVTTGGNDNTLEQTINGTIEITKDLRVNNNITATGDISSANLTTTNKIKCKNIDATNTIVSQEIDCSTNSKTGKLTTNKIISNQAIISTTPSTYSGEDGVVYADQISTRKLNFMDTVANFKIGTKSLGDYGLKLQNGILTELDCPWKLSTSTVTGHKATSRFGHGDSIPGEFNNGTWEVSYPIMRCKLFDHVCYYTINTPNNNNGIKQDEGIRISKNSIAEAAGSPFFLGWSVISTNPKACTDAPRLLTYEDYSYIYIINTGSNDPGWDFGLQITGIYLD